MTGKYQRTEEEKKSATFNYYLVLRISPAEKDPKAIDRAVKTMANSWTKSTAYDRRFADLRGDILKVMVEDLGFDPATGDYTKKGARAEELKAAKAMKLKAASDVVVEMCRISGKLYKSSLVKIYENDRKNNGAFDYEWYTAQDLEKAVSYLIDQGVKFIDDTQRHSAFNSFTKIEENLEHARKTDLYDVIESSPDRSIKELNEAITVAYSKRINKTTSQGTAIGALLGEAKTMFKTEASKKAYDDYLSVKESVWNQLKARVKVGIRTLSVEEYLKYIERIKDAHKTDFDSAEQYMVKCMACYGVTVDGLDSSRGGIDLEICPYPECGKAFSSKTGVKACPHCGRALEVDCWSCGARMPFTSKSKTCPRCKSNYGSKGDFYACAERIDRLLLGGNVDDLRAALGDLKILVPGYGPGMKGPAFDKISGYEAEIARKEQIEKTTGVNYRNEFSIIQDLVSKKRYVQAYNLSSGLRRKYGGYNADATDKLIASVQAIVEQARNFANQARAYESAGNEAMALSFAAKAMDICADCNEAHLILKNHPPKAPSGVKASVVSGNTVRVEWNAGSAGSATYTVIKKIASPPSGYTDGTVVSSGLPITFFEDKKIAGNTPCYYGVFAERFGIRSPLCTTSSPAAIYPEVSDVRQEVVEGVIRVRWDCPQNVRTVEVWKKEGTIAPQRPGEGTRVPTDGSAGFTDSDCKTENSYLIVCRYEYNGVSRYSRGTVRTFKKFVQLKSLEDPAVEQHENGTFSFICKPRDGQGIRLVCAKNQIACRLDFPVSINDYNRVCGGCTLAKIGYTDGQRREFSLPDNDLYWVYPMTYNEQLFMLSKPFLLCGIKGINGLSWTEEHGTVHIRGVLHKDTKRVVARISGSGFPDSLNGPDEQVSITKERFISEGGMSIALKLNTVNYISLFVELEKDGTAVTTGAVKLGSEPIDFREKTLVRHSISANVQAGKSFAVTVEFASDTPITLPKLCLVKGSPRPLTRSAGELVDTIGPLTLKKGLFSNVYTAKVRIVSPPCGLNTRFVVFAYDDRAGNVTLKEVRNI